MKKIILLTFVLIMLILIYKANESDDKQIKSIELTTKEMELKKEYPIKSYHEKITLKCIHCHEGQGSDAKNFKPVEDEQCFSCHGDKRKVANRTSYMNVLYSNPHDSIHDEASMSFSCNECHQAHEESQNQCLNCHPSEVSEWMKEYEE